MSYRPNGSPPPYESDPGYHEPPETVYSYHPDDEFKHFYRWSSPPGIMKIMAVLVIILCVGIFACVASTLAYDTNVGSTGLGFGSYGSSYGNNYGGGYNSFGGGAYGAGSNYGYGAIGGNYNDPRQGKGFMIAMAAFCFIALLAIFIIVVSRLGLSESRRFYLAVIIICTILAFLMLVATIVYLVAINPMMQSSGSVYGNQIMGLCSQFQNPQTAGVFVNQYLYHYCVVEPQEAVAVVFGFLVTAALLIVVIFAAKTRKAIQDHGKDNILWRQVKIIDDDHPPQDVEAWVNNVSGSPDGVVAEYPEKFGSRSHLDDDTDYEKPPYSNSIPSYQGMAPPHSETAVELNMPLRSKAPYSSGSEMASSGYKPKKTGRARRRDGRGYETDGASSGDELDDDDFDSEYPPITNEQQRSNYKHEFDHEHQEYKDVQAELDIINKDLADVDRELDDLEEGSPQFLDALDQYNRLRDLKKSAEYVRKKQRCKYLKTKLSHIKRRVSDYDRGR